MINKHYWELIAHSQFIGEPRLHEQGTAYNVADTVLGMSKGDWGTRNRAPPALPRLIDSGDQSPSFDVYVQEGSWSLLQNVP